MRRLRTVVIVAVVVVITDVTWDGSSLQISFGRPGGKRLLRFAFP